MNKICDLHTHSTYSDGTYTPEEIVRLAKRLRLDAVALTDHNTISGLNSFACEADRVGIEYVFGAELSTEYYGKDVHILALFIPDRSFGKLESFIAEYNERKQKSNDILADNLIRAGYKIDYDKMQAESKATVLNRAHFATELIRKGYCRDSKEAFAKFLSADKPYYIEPKRNDSFEVIRFINSIGAVSVMAHPLISLEHNELLEFLSQAQKCGLDAMETVYSTFDYESTRYLKKLAKKYSLLESGGTDYHGYRKPDINLATGKGNLEVPYSFCENLKKRAMSK